MCRRQSYFHTRPNSVPSRNLAPDNILCPMVIQTKMHPCPIQYLNRDPHTLTLSTSAAATHCAASKLPGPSFLDPLSSASDLSDLIPCRKSVFSLQPIN